MGHYDVTSIMHYNFNGVTVLSRSYFSREDIRRINVLYECQVSDASGLNCLAAISGDELVSSARKDDKVQHGLILIEIFQSRGPQESTTSFENDYARYLPANDETLSTNELRKRM